MLQVAARFASCFTRIELLDLAWTRHIRVHRKIREHTKLGPIERAVKSTSHNRTIIKLALNAEIRYIDQRQPDYQFTLRA